MADPIDLLKRVASENALKADPNVYLKNNQGNYTEALRSMLSDNGLELDLEQETEAHKQYGLPVLNKIFIDENWKTDKEVEDLTSRSNELFDKIKLAKLGQLGFKDLGLDIAESEIDEKSKAALLKRAEGDYSAELAKINDTLAKNDELRSLGFNKVERSPLGQLDYASVKRRKREAEQFKGINPDDIGGFGGDEVMRQKVAQAQADQVVLDKERFDEPIVTTYNTALKNGAAESGTGKNAYVSGLGIMNEADAKLRRQLEMAYEDGDQERVGVLLEHLKAQEDEFARGYGVEVTIRKAEEANRATMQNATKGAGWLEKAGLSVKADVGRAWYNTIAPGVDNFLSKFRDEPLDEFLQRREEQGVKAAVYQKPDTFSGQPMQRYVDVEGQRFKVDRFGDIEYPVDERMNPIKGDFADKAKQYEGNREKYESKISFSPSRLLGTSTEVAVNMLPIILTNVAVSAIPGVGGVAAVRNIASMGASFLTMFNDNFESALQAGGGFDRAWNTAFLTTLPQALIEQIGGFEARTGKVLGDAVRGRIQSGMDDLVRKHATSSTPKKFLTEYASMLKKELPGELAEEVLQDMTGAYMDHVRNGRELNIDPLDEANMALSLPFSVGLFGAVTQGIKKWNDRKRWRESFIAATKSKDSFSELLNGAVTDGKMSQEEMKSRMSPINDNYQDVRDIVKNDRLKPESKDEVLKMVADRALYREQAKVATNNKDKINYQKKADEITDEAIQNKINELEEEKGGWDDIPYTEGDFSGEATEATATDEGGKEPEGEKVPQSDVPTTDGGVGGDNAGGAVAVGIENNINEDTQVSGETATQESVEVAPRQEVEDTRKVSELVGATIDYGGIVGKVTENEGVYYVAGDVPIEGGANPDLSLSDLGVSVVADAKEQKPNAISVNFDKNEIVVNETPYQYVSSSGNSVTLEDSSGKKKTFRKPEDVSLILTEKVKYESGKSGQSAADLVGELENIAEQGGISQSRPTERVGRGVSKSVQSEKSANDLRALSRKKHEEIDNSKKDLAEVEMEMAEYGKLLEGDVLSNKGYENASGGYFDVFDKEALNESNTPVANKGNAAILGRALHNRVPKKVLKSIGGGNISKGAAIVKHLRNLNDRRGALLKGNTPTAVKEKRIEASKEEAKAIKKERDEKEQKARERSGVKLQQTTQKFIPLDQERFDQLLQNLDEALQGKLGGVLSGKEFNAKVKEQGRTISSKGVVYGFIDSKGKVWLNGDEMNANSPVHEYGHVWINTVKTSHPDVYKKGLELVDKTVYVDMLLENPAYKKEADAYKKGNKRALLEEALAWAIGDRGEQIVTVADKKNFKEWLKDFWNSVKEFFGGKITDLTPEQVANLSFIEFVELVAGQLVGGERVNDSSLEAQLESLTETNPEVFGIIIDEYPDEGRPDFDNEGDRKQFAKEIAENYRAAKKDGSNPELVKAVDDALNPKQIPLVKDKDGNLLAPNGKKSNLNETQWRLVRTPEFKAWFGDVYGNVAKINDNFDLIVGALNIKKKC